VIIFDEERPSDSPFVERIWRSHSEEIAQFKQNDLFASDALLMGRVTYQGHAAAWPSMTDEAGFADRMNSLPKYVVSTTLEKVAWNNARLITGNSTEEIKKLKHEITRTILVDGGSNFVHLLIQHNLIDEYRLLVHPVVLGRGKRLFQEDSLKKDLKLIEAKAFKTGVIALTYQVADTDGK
jgi:dihydrofolate reductase